MANIINGNNNGNDHDHDHDTDSITLPVISLSDTSPANASRTLAAATKYGFLYLDTPSTALTRTQIDSIFTLAQRFFSQPVSAKTPYQINTANRGWTGLRNEILDPAHQARGDFKEAFNIGEFSSTTPTTPTPTPSQQLPDVFAERAGEIHAFAETCRQTVKAVLDLLGRGLDIEAEEKEQFFSKRHTQPSGSTVRLLHYPAVDGASGDEVDEKKDIRAGAHSDYGSCTLLFQRLGQPGLEIRTPSGAWAPVAVVPEGYEGTWPDEEKDDDDDAKDKKEKVPPILVNFGDLLSYWTNGLLKSTVHRVVFPQGEKKDRYSIAYFAHPGNDVELVAVPSKLVQEHKFQDGEEVGYGGGVGVEGGANGAGRALTAREHLDKRLQATYEFREEVK